MTDINGFPMSVLFMKGNKHDVSCFKKHVDSLIIVPKNKPKNKPKIMADKAYASNENYKYLEEHNIDHIIPPRSNMKCAETYKYKKSEYIKRIKIEHIFARLKLFRRINLRYCKKIRSFSSFVFFAFSIIGLNILNAAQ